MEGNPFVQVLNALHQDGVRYVVVGGFAAVMHGCNRFTADLDLIVDLKPEQARKAVESLTRLGLRPRAPVDPLQFADSAERQKWAGEKGMQVFTLIDPSTPTFAVDLFVETPADFENLYSRARTVTFNDCPIVICSLDDLIALKKRTGRPQDQADVKDLELIRSQRDAP